MFMSKNIFNSVTINGQTFTCSGSNITISNGNVIVDGNMIQTNIGNNAKVIVNGNVNEIDCSGTVGELIENFVGDLVGCTYSNGSDERMYADQWFDRCWFGMFPEPTLLNHLLNWGYDPEDYLDTLDNIETAIKEKEYLAEHPEEADEEAQYLDDDIESWQEELKDMRADWKPEKEPNMDEELEIIKKWVKEREDLINE